MVLRRFGYKVPVHTVSETLSFNFYTVISRHVWIITNICIVLTSFKVPLSDDPISKRLRALMSVRNAGVWNVVSCIAKLSPPFVPTERIKMVSYLHFTALSGPALRR
jgi:hypothetical protein